MPKTTKTSATTKVAKTSSQSASEHFATQSSYEPSKPHTGLIVSLIAVVVVILGAIIVSVNHQPSNYEQVWDPQMTLGNPDGKNYFIVYSDLACPYCIAFENTLIENEENFQKYLEANDILFEVRLSEYLYESEQQPIHSRYGAVASYCARNEGKFWDYYNHVITTTWNDFYKPKGKNGGYDLIEKDKSYWIDLGRDVGLSDTFASCVENDDTLAEVQANTEKAFKSAQGMPYFKFNKRTIPGGFDLNDDWNDALNLFELGLNHQ